MSESLGQAGARAAKLLGERGIESPALDARMLVQAATGLAREALLLDPGRLLSPFEAERFAELLARRLAGEPVSRLLGRREFWSLDFELAPDTLDPRPDSETLVAALLEEIGDRALPLSLLDLGTGTGCLLLALLTELPNATGLGVDVAPGAVAAAKANAARLGLAERAAFRQGDWCQGIEERFDVILSNPPYIPTADIAALAPEVRLFDPALALDGGRDGLAAYRILARQIPSRLKAGGLAGLEAGAGQAPEIARLCEQAGLNIVGIKRDISGLERAVLVSA